MSCALILEEYIRKNKDQKKDSFIAFLDAKAAFDVVNHASLMRKLFHFGVEGVTWESYPQSTQGGPNSDTLVWPDVKAIFDIAGGSSRRSTQY